MQKVLTAAEMREVDRLTTERYGIPSIILMENAAHAVARVITEKLGGSVKGKSILILCGKGNNGGDGAALARVLWNNGASVNVQLFGRLEDTKSDARKNFESISALSDQGFTPSAWFEEVPVDQPLDIFNFWLDKDLREIDVVVDSIFGTGLERAIDSNLRDVVLTIFRMVSEPADESESHPLFVAVDLPSGLIADEGEAPTFAFFDGDQTPVSAAANVTVTFTAPKAANVLPPAVRLNGDLIVENVGTPHDLIEEQPSQLYVTERLDASAWLRKSEFSPGSYKGKRGHALLIAGSENYGGAAVLCGNAAMRSGVGVVTVGVPRSSKDLIGGRVVPEVMVRPIAETATGAVSEEAIEEIEEFSKDVHAIAIGAGISAKHDSTGRFVRHYVENRTMPTILDADALTLMSPFERVYNSEHPVILTPHEGEFMRLLGTKDKEAIKDRVAAVRTFAQEKNVILVLKGERNLIGHPDGRVVVNPTGNSGLGKAGNGDTLLGILAGFVAQAAAMDIDIFETVVAGVYIAGLAGDIAAERYGKRVMTASDTRECLGEAFRQCMVEK